MKRFCSEIEIFMTVAQKPKHIFTVRRLLDLGAVHNAKLATDLETNSEQVSHLTFRTNSKLPSHGDREVSFRAGFHSSDKKT